MQRSGAAAALTAFLLGGCIVSFEGYELGSSGGGGMSGGGGASGGGAGGTSGGGGAGTSGGGTSGGGATGTSGGGASGGGAAGGGASGSGGTSGGGASGASGGSGTGGATGQCPSPPGTSPMIQVAKPGGGEYCIDAFEVTNAHYRSFEVAAGTKTQHSQCGSNTSFAPAASPNCNYDWVNKASNPVACIDWCDAWAFCNFVGKRLCGGYDGQPGHPSSSADPALSQWFNACSAAGSRSYCWGNLYNESTWDTCNGLEHAQPGTVEVSSLASCQGGYPGIFHMSGNVREWEDSCSTAGSCATRGGGFFDSGGTGTGPSLACSSSVLEGRLTFARDRGFRCCADLP
jgi:formylglycine-generating enzyme